MSEAALRVVPGISHGPSGASTMDKCFKNSVFEWSGVSIGCSLYIPVLFWADPNPPPPTTPTPSTPPGEVTRCFLGSARMDNRVRNRPPDSNTAPIHFNVIAHPAHMTKKFLTPALKGT